MDFSVSEGGSSKKQNSLQLQPHEGQQGNQLSWTSWSQMEGPQVSMKVLADNFNMPRHATSRVELRQGFRDDTLLDGCAIKHGNVYGLR